MQPSTSKSADDDGPSNSKQEKRPEHVAPSRPPTPPSSINSPSRLRSRRWQKATAIGASVVVGQGVAATVVWVAVKHTDAQIQDVSCEKWCEPRLEYTLRGSNNYAGAKKSCERDHMTLAMPNSKDQATYLYWFILKQSKSTIAYIGLELQGGSYRWNDGSYFESAFSFGNSPYYQKSGKNCVVLQHREVLWVIVATNCGENHQFICQSKPKKPTTTTTTTKKTTTTRAPTTTPTTTTAPDTPTTNSGQGLGFKVMLVFVAGVVILTVATGVYWYRKKVREQAQRRRRLAQEWESTQVTSATTGSYAARRKQRRKQRYTRNQQNKKYSSFISTTYLSKPSTTYLSKPSTTSQSKLSTTYLSKPSKSYLSKPSTSYLSKPSTSYISKPSTSYLSKPSATSTFSTRLKSSK